MNNLQFFLKKHKLIHIIYPLKGYIMKPFPAIFYRYMDKLQLTTLDIYSEIFVFEGRILMTKNKLGREKDSINAYKSGSGILDTEMASMYDLPEKPIDIVDANLEEKNKWFSNKSTVRILNDDMASMYNMLKNK